MQVDPPALEPEDFYMEGEALVFTAAYHQKRGYCCGSGCRHCPWREKEEQSQVLPLRDASAPLRSE